MRPPIFIRPLTEDEQRKILAGLHSSNAFILCLCQILLASARGERVPKIALQLGCDDQTVRNVIHGFNADGLRVLGEGPSRPHRLRTTFSQEAAQQLPAILHRRPQEFGKESGQWTLELAAQAGFDHFAYIGKMIETSNRARRRVVDIHLRVAY